MRADDVGFPAGPGLPPPDWRSLTSPTWRLWLAEHWTESAEHLVSVTSETYCLARVEAIVTGVVLERFSASLAAIRLARDAAVLSRLNQIPAWAGRAITLYTGDRATLLQVAQEVDKALSGQGLSGPPSWRGRPYGGQSGMLFLGGAPGGRCRHTSGTLDRLTALLGGAGV